MKAHGTGRLRAFLDGELSTDERQALEAHLDQCAACAGELELLRALAKGAAARLDGLGQGDVSPDPRTALVRFKQARFNEAPVQVAPKAGPAAWSEKVMRSFEMFKQNAVSSRWRPAVVALSAVLVVALLFSVAPVRSFAADFLSLFRVRKFTVIPLDSGQMDKLDQFAQQAENQLGKPQIVREEGPAQAVTDAAQASSLAGYTVRTPSRLPSTLALTKFSVRSGPAMHYEVDRATLAAFLQAAGASAEGLPQSDKLSFDVDIANFVGQQYGGANGLEFVQVPAPQVNLPEGINPAALAETAFGFLGMPAEDAKRMADSIDWTSTLVVPLPKNAAQAREVTVDGVTGLMIEGTNNNRNEKMLMWEKDGILYSMNGRVDTTVLLDAADSLQ